MNIKIGDLYQWINNCGSEHDMFLRIIDITTDGDIITYDIIDVNYKVTHASMLTLSNNDWFKDNFTLLSRKRDSIYQKLESAFVLAKIT